ncbi:MAG: hypothetical protein MJ252_19300 [archaeon]|nr:hypothetical protein [archaeon]
MKKIFIAFLLIASILASEKEKEKIRNFIYCVNYKMIECAHLPHCTMLKDLADLLENAHVESLKDLRKLIEDFKNIPEVKVCYETYIR